MVAPTAPTAAVKYQQSSERFRIKENTSKGVMIKGFMSVKEPDRDGDLIDPSAFDLDAFRRNPQVMVNHSLWIDRQGNRTGVGTVKSIHNVKIRRGSERGLISIYDVETKSVIDEVPRDQYSDLRVGTRGVYVFIHVTDPDVVTKVREGELTAFSWRGKSVPAYEFDEERQQSFKGYSYIDLWEVSLVNLPANPHSSFSVEKSCLHSVWFDAGEFSDADVQALAQRYLGDHSVSQTDGKYYAYTEGALEDTDGLQVVKMAEGLTMVVRPAPEPETLSSEQVSEFVNSVSKSHTEGSKEMSGSAVAEETKVVAKTDEEAPDTEATETAAEETSAKETAVADTEDTATEESTEETTAETTDENEDAEKSADVVSSAVTKVMENINPILETVTDTLKQLSSTVAALDEKVAKGAQVPEADPEPTPEEVEIAKSAKIQDELNGLKKQLADVTKSVSQTVPAHPAREESKTEDVEKDADVKDADPNNVFNALFGVK